jgi:pSer/pThr/pTyr-binding forkhead associated (FHA) protein
MTALPHAPVWLIDELWAKAYPLSDLTTIGRGPQNTIILRDVAVSRLHAEIKRESGSYVLQPYGMSGTKVNGVLVSINRPLQEGDLVEIAFSRLRFTTRAPTHEIIVIERDMPTTKDIQEGPTQAVINAISREIVAMSRRRWLRLWHWLTRRANTD